MYFTVDNMYGHKTGISMVSIPHCAIFGKPISIFRRELTQQNPGCFLTRSGKVIETLGGYLQISPC